MVFIPQDIEIPLEKGLCYGVIRSTSDSLYKQNFSSLYDAYCYFYHGKDRVDKKQLESNLVRSNDPHYQKLFYPNQAREFWIYIKNDKNKIIGASNFAVFKGEHVDGMDGTSHIIYTFVYPQYREIGVFLHINRLSKNIARLFINPRNPTCVRFLCFTEQKTPLLMTIDEYMEDIYNSNFIQRNSTDDWNEIRKSAKLLPEDRRIISENLYQAQTLSFHYLHYEDTLIESFDFLLVFSQGKPVAKKSILEHLRLYYLLSFPEGITLDHPDLAPMMEDLERRGETIDVVEKGKFQNIKKALDGIDLNSEYDRNIPIGKIFNLGFE